MSLDQHASLDTELVGKRLPKWLPAVDLDPDWHIDTGDFPHVTDAALREPEETPDA